MKKSKLLKLSCAAIVIVAVCAAKWIGGTLMLRAAFLIIAAALWTAAAVSCVDYRTGREKGLSGLIPVIGIAAVALCVSVAAILTFVLL